jgi:RNA polymerase sigma-70 factor, ECF subfamily
MHGLVVQGLAMPPDELSALISRVALADRAAFAALYRATSAKLFGICLRILGNRPEAEDALQEAYVKVWNRAATFAPGGMSPMGWMVSVARNQAIDVLRQRRGGHVDIEAAFDLADSAPDAEDTLAAKGDAAKLHACLDGLERKKADAVRLAYLEGWSYIEVAEKLDIPLNTVRTWLRRGLLALRECLGR